MKIPSRFSFPRALAGGVLLLFGAAQAPRLQAHGSLQNSRMLQVRIAGPNGHTPAPWNDSYYTWNQNSRNFPTYANAGFTYASVVPDGSISNAGINDGVHSGLNFSGLNTPSAGWQKTAVAAGGSVHLNWLATATHDPSYFEVYLTRQGFDVGAQSLGWGNLEYVGRWAVGDATHPATVGASPNPVSGGTMPSYGWDVKIPADRSGHHALVVIWQRVDPAGEAFLATQDLTVTAAVSPTLNVTLAADRTVSLQLRGAANTAYDIQASTDLSAWSVVGRGTTDSAGALAVADPAAPSFPRRFYRAVTSP